MRNFLIIFSLISSQFLIAQIQGKVIDSVTDNNIPYVNIMIENENIGATSDEKGLFQLNLENTSKTVIFSAIGYETKRIEYDKLKDSIQLNPILDPDSRNSLTSKEDRKTKEIGEYNKSEIKRFFGAGNLPGITARFFVYNNSYSKTPFLKTISVLTSSDISKAKFLIKLYKKDINGKPGDFLYHKNIIGTARRGKRSTKIDVSDLNIKFPENGLFIAVEWLIIEDNKFEYSYIKLGKSGESKDISYEPSFGMISSLKSGYSWIFNQGKWIETWIDSNSKEYNLLALKLELSD